MARKTVVETDVRPFKKYEVTDPALNAAVSTTILDTYSLIIITTTWASNAQTLQSPTVTTDSTRVTIANNDTSTDAITINWTSLAVWTVVEYVWDWSAWVTEAEWLSTVDLTSDVTGILPSANWGTANWFTKFSWPTTAEKTFTLPDSSQTLLYSWGALWTPSSWTATNITGLPIAWVVWDTSTALWVWSIELWHASDTTITRASAWTIAVEWVEILDTTYRPTETIIVAISDESTALTTWTAKVTFRMPYAFTLTAVRASLTWAGSTSWVTTFDINETGTTILSTKLTIDYWEKTSTTAATPAVISDSSLADDAEITIDIDVVTGWADETGAKIYLIGNRT